MITLNNLLYRFEQFADANKFINAYSQGDPSDMDLAKNNKYPLLHVNYTGADYAEGEKTYQMEIYILFPYKVSDKSMEVHTISDAEQVAEDILAEIENGGTFFEFNQNFRRGSASLNILREEGKSVLAGVLLSLSITVGYEFDACNV